MAGKPSQQWSDQEIREALDKYNLNIPLTASTRPFLIKKLEGILNTSPLVETDGVNSSTAEKKSPDIQTSSLSVNPVLLEGYYGVAAGPSTPNGEVSRLSPFYTSKSDALKAIKGIPGARFKRFDSPAKAEEFSQQPTEVRVDETDFSSEVQTDSHTVDVKVSEKANNFPSVKTPDLSRFRTFIENGELDSFLDCIERNPRHLITAGDTPEILKKGVYYNALHCAVIFGQLEICRQLLWILQSDQFWSMLYPDDDPNSIRPARKLHLLDLYLNMQDRGFGETPLHFACKLGFIEIVALLVSFSLTSTSIKNKSGKTPVEVICQKVVSPKPEHICRIEQLLREPEVFYVPVLRTEGNSTPPRLGQPLTLDQLDDMESQVYGCELPELSNGLAGPMSPSSAQQFYQQWKTPRHRGSKGRQLARIKRSDSDRGLERIGRELAHLKDVGWVEYWEFLGCACDLSKPEGLQLLEEFLESKSSLNNYSNPPIEDSESPVHPGSNKGVNSTDMNVSRKLFVEDDEEEVGVMEKSGHETDDLSELLSKKLSLEPNNEPLFISGPAPTKLDYDVFLALCEVSPDPSKYPCIAKWLSLLESFPEEVKKSWITPRKQQRFSIDHTPSSHPVSPLVYSSPSVHHHSPLVTPGKKNNSISTTPQQGSLRFWHTTSTTPRRHGRILTPTRYSQLSFTPRF